MWCLLAAKSFCQEPPYMLVILPFWEQMGKVCIHLSISLFSFTGTYLRLDFHETCSNFHGLLAQILMAYIHFQQIYIANQITLFILAGTKYIISSDAWFVVCYL